MPRHLICHEADISNGRAVVDWCNFFRDEAENYVERHSEEIGGFDGQGEPIVVEIGKYHRGHWQWVFGGIERESGKCFLISLLCLFPFLSEMKKGTGIYCRNYGINYLLFLVIVRFGYCATVC